MSAARFAPWQQHAFERVLASHAEGRLGHGLLVCGPARLGKRALAEAIAARLLCRGAQPAEPACGRCRSCLLLAAGNHPDLHRVSFALNDKGEPRSVITVEQIRALSEKLALTPQLDGAIVSLIAPADALNVNAANALLKTLEEPQPGRYLLLLSDAPQRLSATIRSRCQRIELRPPSAEDARAWLLGLGLAAAEVDTALDAADGHPGEAHALLEEGGLALRAAVQAELDALALGRAGTVETAKAWLADRPAERLSHAAALARSEGRRLLVAGESDRFEALHSWFEQTNRLRAQLEVPLRHDLLLGELLAGWAARRD